MKFHLLAPIAFILALSACNTLQGAGQDVESAGEAIQQEAR